MRRSRASSATSWSRCTTPAEAARHAPVAFVAFGANLGDRAKTFRGALAALAALGAVDAASSVWATAAVGGPSGQPDYLNAVVRWRPSPAWATPERALGALLAIEAGLGRLRRERWGPRTVDLDLLDGAGWAPVVPGGRGTTPTLPHPRAAERAFVLVPWAEVAPEWPAPPQAEAPPLAGASVVERAVPRTVEGLMLTSDRTGVRPAAGAVVAAWRAAVADVLAPDRAMEGSLERG